MMRRKCRCDTRLGHDGGRSMRSIGDDGVIDVMRCDKGGTSLHRRQESAVAVGAMERRTLRTLPVKEASSEGSFQ
jgi:hypothetical protein